MASFGDLLGSAGNEGKTLFLWGIMVGMVNQLIDPMRRELGYLVNDADPNVIASPPDLAEMVVRGIKQLSDAAAEAHSSGTNETRFKELVDLAGEPPSLQSVLEWWRRGYVDWGEIGPDKANVANAIATSRVYTYWSDTIRKAQFTPPSPSDAVAAVLRGQISKAEGVAMAYFGGLGVSSLSVPGGADTADTERAFDILLNTVGNPPSLSELIELVRRGLIPMGDLSPLAGNPNPAELSFAQGIREGNNKDKWIPIYAKLTQYIPPPRTVTAVYKAGGYTEAQAKALYVANGLTEEDASAYIAGASGEKLAGTKQLAESAITTLYFDQALNAQEATGLLNQLGYSDTDAQFILAITDFRREQTAITSAVSRLQTLYVDHKIDGPTVIAALGQLGVPGSQQQHLLQTWTLESGANVKILTETQIVDAWSYNILSQDEAMSELEGIGYTPLDAWTLLSNKNKGPLPGKPAAGPNPLYPLPGS